MPADRVLLGAVIGAHGIRGEVRVKTFTAEPSSLGAYGTLVTGDGRELRVDQVSSGKPGEVIVWFGGVRDRTAAEAMKGIELFVPRAALPEPEENEFYHADLVGLVVEDETGAPLGRVKGVFNFGAGDLVEIETEGGETSFVPFTTHLVPTVDLKNGRLVVRPTKDTDNDNDSR